MDRRCPMTSAKQVRLRPSPPEPLVETARGYARAATSRNTNRAYAADWRDYLGWRLRQGLESRPLADVETVGPLCRRPRLRRRVLGRHHRAPALGARVEFRGCAVSAAKLRRRSRPSGLGAILNKSGSDPRLRFSVMLTYATYELSVWSWARED